MKVNNSTRNKPENAEVNLRCEHFRKMWSETKDINHPEY
jgi:hypothetical protein